MFVENGTPKPYHWVNSPADAEGATAGGEDKTVGHDGGNDRMDMPSSFGPSSTGMNVSRKLYRLYVDPHSSQRRRGKIMIGLIITLMVMVGTIAFAVSSTKARQKKIAADAALAMEELDSKEKAVNVVTPSTTTRTLGLSDPSDGANVFSIADSPSVSVSFLSLPACCADTDRKPAGTPCGGGSGLPNCNTCGCHA